VHLDLLHVDGAGTDRDGDLVSVTGTVITVGGGELPELWAVLLQQGVFGEVGSITTSGQDDRAIGGLGLSTKGVLDTNDDRTILDELGDASLLLDDDALGVADREVLKTLHLSVCDDLYKRSASVAGMTRGKHMRLVAHHAGELSITTVGSWLTVTTKSSNLGKVELELVLQPVDSISGTASQDGDKIVAGEVTSL
jgi:hypothetical protein